MACTKPGCFPYCDCGSADDYVPATPSEDGGEVPEVVAYTDFSTDSGVQLSQGMNAVGDDIDLMTVAQCKRIVAAKDAEIARLRELHENAHSAAKTLMAERATLMEQAAGVVDSSAPLVNALEQVRTMVGNDEYADDVIGFINRSIYNHANLNRRAIPVELLERIAQMPSSPEAEMDRYEACDELRALLGK